MKRIHQRRADHTDCKASNLLPKCQDGSAPPLGNPERRNPNRQGNRQLDASSGAAVALLQHQFAFQQHRRGYRPGRHVILPSQDSPPELLHPLASALRFLPEAVQEQSTLYSGRQASRGVAN
jgi:hypothetical protein